MVGRPSLAAGTRQVVILYLIGEVTVPLSGTSISSPLFGSGGILPSVGTSISPPEQFLILSICTQGVILKLYGTYTQASFVLWLYLLRPSTSPASTLYAMLEQIVLPAISLVTLNVSLFPLTLFTGSVRRPWLIKVF